MDICALDTSGSRSDSGLMNLSGGAMGTVVPGEGVGGGLWRDLDLLRAGCRKSPLSPMTGVRQNMKHLLNESKGLYEETLRHLGNKDESQDTLKEQQLKWEVSNEETDRLRGENLNVKIDLDTLIDAIQQADKMQKFDPEAKEYNVYSLETEHQNGKTEAHKTALQEQNEPDVDHKSFQQVQHKVENKKDTIIELKGPMKQLQRQYNEAVEENGRLQARLEAWMITAQSEHEILSKEVFCKEDIIHKLRKKQLSQDEKCNTAEQKIQHQEKLLKQLHQKYLTAVNVVENQQQIIHSLEQDFQTAMIAEKEMATGVAECEETIKHLEMELSSLHSAQELDNKTITQKKQIIHELQQESNSLKQKLKEALCKICQKDSKLCALEEELMEAQKQYSACYEEVSNQDQIILKLKTNLKAAQEKYKGAQEEVEKHEDTIQKQKYENMHLREQIEMLQNKVTESNNQAMISESTADRYKQKYQTSSNRMHDLQNHVQSLKKNQIIRYMRRMKLSVI